ncbi:MAG: hypothetical protein UT33_C0005G0104 [Candidatus Peregrinibacteria bacterium GW2011_GWC2_39_14]|nr:MAG: hypothetical protein US92_C0001G0104 [Candidatus Peregrinibacteria bacterium GW2011_GWA2_38_36]KKR07160.1 MAG: hypothetical protein UT33_C0005G0104 [Candidatus Peregrinibacteria bacterium GW2011_GWC2_39_14]
MGKGLLAIGAFVAALGATAPEARSSEYGFALMNEAIDQHRSDEAARRAVCGARGSLEEFLAEMGLTEPVSHAELPVCEQASSDDSSDQQDETTYPEISDVTEDSGREVFETLSAPGGEEPMDVDVDASVPVEPQAQEPLEPVDHLDVVDGQVLPLAQPPIMRKPQLDLSSAAAMRMLTELRAQEEARDQMLRMVTGVSPTDLGERDGLIGSGMGRVLFDPTSGAMAFPGQKMVVFPDSVDPLERARIIEALQREVDLDAMKNAPHHW